MFREDRDYAAKAKRVSAIAKDITEYLATLALNQPARGTGQTVAYHSACSMQHGQKIKEPPKRLLSQMGFNVKDIPESHICCGSAGIYNIMQPQIARRLRARKVANIEKTKPEIIAAGNIGCIVADRTRHGFADCPHRGTYRLGAGRPTSRGARRCRLQRSPRVSRSRRAAK